MSWSSLLAARTRATGMPARVCSHCRLAPALRPSDHGAPTPRFEGDRLFRARRQGGGCPSRHWLPRRASCVWTAARSVRRVARTRGPRCSHGARGCLPRTRLGPAWSSRHPMTGSIRLGAPSARRGGLAARQLVRDRAPANCRGCWRSPSRRAAGALTAVGFFADRPAIGGSDGKRRDWLLGGDRVSSMPPARRCLTSPPCCAALGRSTAYCRAPLFPSDGSGPATFAASPGSRPNAAGCGGAGPLRRRAAASVERLATPRPRAVVAAPPLGEALSCQPLRRACLASATLLLLGDAGSAHRRA